MYVVKLSSKDQLVLPASLLQARSWRAGGEFVLEEVAEGVLLRARKPLTEPQPIEVYKRLHSGTWKGCHERQLILPACSEFIMRHVIGCIFCSRSSG